MKKKNENGFSILEILIGMSTNILLLAGGIILLYCGVKSYVYSISDFELIEEVRHTAQMINDTIRYGYDKEISENSISVYIKDISTNNFLKVNYRVSDKGIVYYNYQPITGDSVLGNIKIRRLLFSDNNDGSVHIVVEGVNLINGHSFSIENNVLCYAEIMERHGKKIIK